MDESETPAQQSQLVRSRLRQLREEAGFTQHEVAVAMDWSTSKILRIENGASRIQVGDVRLLLQHYGVTDPAAVQEFVDSARTARTRTWRDRYRKYVDPNFYEFLGCEAAALEIRQYQSVLVPDLLQTEPYARAVLLMLHDQPETVEQLAALREKRQQELLRGSSNPDARFVIDEAALRREVGGPLVMRDQLRHLKSIAELPNVVVQLVPFSSGAHPGMVAPSFTIFDFAEVSRIVFVQARHSQTAIRGNASMTLAYERDFTTISSLALSPDATLAFIERVGSQFEKVV